MDVAGDVFLDRICPNIIDLQPEWRIIPAALGTLSGIMFGLPTTETEIVALAFFSHWVGYNILDLRRGLVDILLPIGLVLYLRLLLGTSLLHRLNLLPWFKLALVIII